MLAEGAVYAENPGAYQKAANVGRGHAGERARRGEAMAREGRPHAGRDAGRADGLAEEPATMPAPFTPQAHESRLTTTASDVESHARRAEDGDVSRAEVSELHTAKLRNGTAVILGGRPGFR